MSKNISYIFLLFSFISFAQNIKDYELKLKQYHEGTITDVIINDVTDELFSCDTYGQILIHNSINFEFVKSLNLNNSTPIKNIRLINNNQLAVFYNDDKPYLAIYDLISNKIIQNIEGVWLTNINSDSLLALGRTDNKNHFVDLYTKTPFKKINSIAIGHKVLKTALSKDNKNISTIEMVIPAKGVNGETEIIHSFKVYDIETNKKIYEEEFAIYENDYIPSGILYENESILLILTVYEMSQPLFGSTCGIRFLRYNTANYKSEKIEEFLFCSNLANTKLIAQNNDKVLVFGNKNKNKFINLDYIDGRYKISLSENNVKNKKYNFHENFDIGIYNFKTSEYSLFNNSEIFVLDTDKKRLEKNIETINFEGNEAYFIYENDWVIIQNNKVIKYFKSGYLSNDFNFEIVKNELLKQNEVPSLTKIIDKKNGKLGYYTNPIKWNSSSTFYETDYSKTQFYSFNLQDGNVQKIQEQINSLKDYTYLAYNGNQDAFLIGIKLENQEIEEKIISDEKAKLMVVDKTGSYIINNNYIYYGTHNLDNFKFSNDGKFICVKSNKNMFIYDWKKNVVVYEKTDGYVDNIIPINSNDFIISGPDFNYDVSNLENKNNISYRLKLVNNQYIITDKNNYNISDAAFSGNTFVKMFPYKISINDKFVDLKNERLKSISLNKEGTKLLVNFFNGKIRLFDIKKHEWLNTIINFDNEEHLIFNTKGYYYTNKDELNSFLLIKKDNQFLSIKNHGNNLYNPISILSDFGDINNDYETVLKKATLLRKKNNTFLFNNKLNIKDFYLAEKANTYETSKIKNRIKIDMFDNSTSNINFKIKINNVEQRNLTFKKVNNSSYEVEISLTQEENIVEIIAQKNKISSLPIRKKMLFNGSINDRNLYVLSIGVSDYKESANNLNYAHKDAIDFAMRYGKFTKEQVENYLNDNFPFKIIVQNDTIILNTIVGNKFIKNEYSSSKQLSINGKKWLQYIINDSTFNEVRQFRIYDFKTKKSKIIDLEEPLYSDNEYYTFRTKADESGFYFNTFFFDNDEIEQELIYYYDFNLEKLNTVKLPMSLADGFIVNNTDWLAIDSENLKEDFQDFKYTNTNKPISISIYSKKNKLWIKKTYPIEIKENVEMSLFKVNDNGKLLIAKIRDIESNEENFVVYNLINNVYVPNKNIIEDNYSLLNFIHSKNWYFDENFKTLNTVQSEYAENDYFYSFNLETGKLKETILGEFKDNQLIGFSFGQPFYIKHLSTKNSNLSDNESFMNLQKEIEKLQNQQPISFKNTYVNYIINEDANSITIKNSIKNFFKEAKPEDQIILFLAGHGVLSKDLDYFFATHDINFEKPQNKGVSFNTIVDLLNESPAIQKLLIMDTCHAGNTLDIENYEYTYEQTVEGHRGSIAKSNKKNNDDLKISTVVNSIFDNFISKTGITVLSASTGENVAYEYNGFNNGAFTKSLLDLLKNNIKNNYKYSYTPDEYYFNQKFTEKLQNILSEKTDNKQKLDVREFNNLVQILLW